MSYTPHSEDIEEEKSSLVVALRAFVEKRRNRANVNGGGWTEGHRRECNTLAHDLTAMQMRIEKV